MKDNGIQFNDLVIMDRQRFFVYCRWCRRSDTFWDQIKHTKRCRYADELRRIDESGEALFTRYPMTIATGRDG